MDERFWAKVETGNGCWNWRAARFQRKSGHPSYGMFSFRKKLWPAHRVAWTLVNGEIPDGLMVLHHCDNVICVRPSHLYVGTHSDNMRDAVSRHRMASGARQHASKLTEDDLPRIRALVAGGMATEKIGPIFGVSGRTIRYVVRREHWKYATQ